MMVPVLAVIGLIALSIVLGWVLCAATARSSERDFYEHGRSIGHDEGFRLGELSGYDRGFTEGSQAKWSQEHPEGDAAFEKQHGRRG